MIVARKTNNTSQVEGYLLEKGEYKGTVCGSIYLSAEHNYSNHLSIYATHRPVKVITVSNLIIK